MNVRTRAGLLLMSLCMAVLVSGCNPLIRAGLEIATMPVDTTTQAEESAVEPVSGGDQFPDVIGVELRPLGAGRYDVSVTISSPYDSPQRYADGWRVTDGAGNILGTHTLLHDHAGEQPFTRTESGLEIPAGVTEITVQGRDQANGYGGLSMTVVVPNR